MELSINDERRTVEVWLSNEEKNDPAVQQRLKPLYAEYAEKKYTVAVFMSGSQDLYSLTSDLLCYNRKRIAELEVEQEKEQGMSFF